MLESAKIAPFAVAFQEEVTTLRNLEGTLCWHGHRTLLSLDALTSHQINNDYEVIGTFEG